MTNPARVIVAGALAGLLASAAAGCGTTRVVTNVPSARIYVDGRAVGKGSGEFRRRGVPGSATIVVVAPDGRRAVKRVKRRFTTTTFLAGLFTDAIGWLTVWEYPDTVYVELEEPAAVADWSAGDDVWLKPPPGWEPAAPAVEPEPDSRVGPEPAPAVEPEPGDAPAPGPE